MQSATDAAAPDPSHANGHASADASDAAQLAPLPKNPLWKNESAVLSFVTTLIGGVHANVADQLDPSVLAQLSMTSLYAHIEEQLGAVAGVDYDKAWLRTKVDQIMFRNTTGASVVESSLEELPVRTPTSLAWGGGEGESGGGGGGGAAAAAAAAQAAGAAAAAAASRATAAAERRRREAREKRAAADRRARLDAAVTAEAARVAAAVDGGGGGDGCGIREISSATAAVCAAPEVSTAVGRPVVAAPAAELAAAAEYIARRQAAVDSAAAPATAVAGATAGAQRANAYNVASSAAALSGCLAAAAPAAIAAAAVSAAP